MYTRVTGMQSGQCCMGGGGQTTRVTNLISKHILAGRGRRGASSPPHHARLYIACIPFVTNHISHDIVAQALDQDCTEKQHPISNLVVSGAEVHRAHLLRWTSKRSENSRPPLKRVHAAKAYTQIQPPNRLVHNIMHQFMGPTSHHA